MSAAIAGGLLVVVLGFRFRPVPVRVAELTAGPAPVPAAKPTPLTAAARRIRRRSPRSPDPLDVADWCARLAAACRSGATLSGAVRSTAEPVSAAHAVRSVVLALERGTPLSEAAEAAGRADHLDLALTVIRACALAGSPAAEPLDRAAAALRARAAEAADRATHSAQARLSAVVMTVLPVAMLGLTAATSSSVRGALATPAGVTCVALGAMANIAGWRWMRRIIARAAA